MMMTRVLSPTSRGVVPVLPQRPPAALDFQVAYDEAFRLYHAARSEAEMEAALSAIEAAERDLEALCPFI